MTRRDDIVAALKRAAEKFKYDGELLRHAEDGIRHIQPLADAALLRALADALREGVDDTYPIVNEHGLRAIGPVWIIPEPRIARRALSNEEE